MASRSILTMRTHYLLHPRLFRTPWPAFSLMAVSRAREMLLANEHSFVFVRKTAAAKSKIKHFIHHIQTKQHPVGRETPPEQ